MSNGAKLRFSDFSQRFTTQKSGRDVFLVRLKPFRPGEITQHLRAHAALVDN